MYRLIIVEDEPYMSEFISKCINWNEIGVYVNGIYCDGNKAFESIKNCPPDIIITDINMPRMNGLELIKKVKEIDHNINFIVISGYNDFYMVKDAFKLGVSDYFLKAELEPSILKQLILNILVNKEKLTLEGSSNNDLLIKCSKLKDVFWGSDSRNVKLDHLRIDKNDMSVMVMKILNWDIVKNDIWKFDKELLKYGIQNVIEELLQNEKYGEAFFEEECDVTFIFSGSSNIYLKKIKNITDQITEKLKSIFDIDAIFGFSGFVSEYSDLKNLYSKALVATKYFFVTNDKNFIDYNFQKKLIYQRKIDKNQLMVDFSRYLIELNFEGLEINIKNFIIDSAHIDDLDDILEVYNYYISQIKTIFLKFKINFDFIKYNEIQKYGTLTKINDYIKLRIHDIKLFFLEDSNSMLLIQKYVKSNYSKELTLNLLAEKFNIDYTKLSRDFSKVVGTSFKKYLTDIRMKEALELIKTTDFKIYEIAQTVGYNNYETFSRVFMKYFGKWPKQFKE